MDHAEELFEIEQIKRLKAQYFRYLDSKQWRKFQALFTDDAEIWRTDQTDVSAEPVLQSLDDFVSGMETRHAAARVVSAHHGHMPEIEILDERHARGIWSMFDWVDRPGQSAFRGYGHYFEEYEKGDDGRWRIASWRLSRLRVDQLPSTIESAPNFGYVPTFWPT